MNLVASSLQRLLYHRHEVVERVKTEIDRNRLPRTSVMEEEEGGEVEAAIGPNMVDGGNVLVRHRLLALLLLLPKTVNRHRVALLRHD